MYSNTDNRQQPVLLQILKSVWQTSRSGGWIMLTTIVISILLWSRRGWCHMIVVQCFEREYSRNVAERTYSQWSLSVERKNVMLVVCGAVLQSLLCHLSMFKDSPKWSDRSKRKLHLSLSNCWTFILREEITVSIPTNGHTYPPLINCALIYIFFCSLLLSLDI